MVLLETPTLIHDYIRGKGTFLKTIKNIRKLIKHKFKIEINFTVNGVNKHQAVGAVKFFKSLGIKQINFHMISMIGNASKNKELYLSPREWVKLRKELENIKEIKGITMRIPLMFVTQTEYQKLIESKKISSFSKTFLPQ